MTAKTSRGKSRWLVRHSALARMLRLKKDNRGVAAVEFALILPLMLLLYIGTAEMTHGLMANRKMVLVTRALSDLVAQEDDQTSGVSDATLNGIFAAAGAIMSPFSTSTLRMTVSSIEFVSDGATPPNYTARTVWSVRRNSSPYRPCQNMVKVTNTTKPTPTTMPEGIYQDGTVIVADVSYNYTPSFGGQFLAWSDTQSSIPMNHTTYMRPRTQTEIKYQPSTLPPNSQTCAYDAGGNGTATYGS